MSASTDTQSKQTQDTKTDPWAAQQPYLLQAFSGAQNALGQAQQSQAPSNFVAGATPDQMATYSKMLGIGNDTSAPQAQIGTGSSLINPGASGILSSIKGFSNFNPGTFQDALNSASSYANGVDVSGAVKAAMRDATNQANEVTIPGMEYGAGNTGNINSSRVGLAEGVVQRDLANKAADLSATMRNDAFNTGLSGALSQQANANSSNLGALSGLLSSATGATGTGANLTSGGIGDLSNLLGLAQQGGAGQQAANQSTLDNQLSKYQFGANAPFDALKNFMSIIGGQQWGGQTQGTSTGTGTSTTNNPLGLAAGLIGATGSLIKSDINTKKDIVKIGQLDDGMPIYRFRYKDEGNGPYYIGLMAQDVEQVTPEAIHEVDGVKYVDYEIATDHLAATRH